MASRNFLDLIRAQWDTGRIVCVGLDSELEKIPDAARITESSPYAEKLRVGPTLHKFNSAIIDATAYFACAYKLNSAFYEAQGHDGIKALRDTASYILQKHPSKLVILDAKRGDIGNTNRCYAEFAFEYVQADAVTVNPYLGGSATWQPFLDYKDKGIFILCRTSNRDADTFQNLLVHYKQGFNLVPLYQRVAQEVADDWNTNGNCGLIVGATHPQDLAEVRKIAGDLPILIPGIGAQGGDLEAILKAGADCRGQGMIINSSRGIIFASQEQDYAAAAAREAQRLHEEVIKQLLAKGTAT